jgi:hypothetical protein
VVPSAWVLAGLGLLLAAALRDRERAPAAVIAEPAMAA